MRRGDACGLVQGREQPVRWAGNGEPQRREMRSAATGSLEAETGNGGLG
jgi:hypothetical protein